MICATGSDVPYIALLVGFDVPSRRSWNRVRGTGMTRKITFKTVGVGLFIAALFYWARPSAPVYFVGAAFILAGEALRLWAAGHLHKNRVVTTTGPYAHVKNPLYLGTLLILLGFCGAARHGPLLLAGLAVFVFYYAPTKQRTESARLADLFGAEWTSYDQAVPDYFPRWRAYPLRSDQTWTWSRVVGNSEHQTAMTVAVGLMLLATRI